MRFSAAHLSPSAVYPAKTLSSGYSGVSIQNTCNIYIIYIYIYFSRSPHHLKALVSLPCIIPTIYNLFCGSESAARMRALQTCACALYCHAATAMTVRVPERKGEELGTGSSLEINRTMLLLKLSRSVFFFFCCCCQKTVFMSHKVSGNVEEFLLWIKKKTGFPADFQAVDVRK